MTIAALCLNLCNYEKYDMKLVAGSDPVNLVRTVSGDAAELPFSLSLDKLERETYNSGKEKALTAVIAMRHGESTGLAAVGVNHPYFFHQYGIYLFDLGQVPSGEDYVRLKVTVSKFRVPVFIGLVLMIASSVFLLACAVAQLWRRKKKGLFAVLLLVMAASVALIMTRMNPMLRSAEVPPILRSVWFLPHVIAYVVSYALMACACIAAFTAMVKHDTDSHAGEIFAAGLSLYTLGLVLGVFWAHYAWGSFWSWDIKETLALITWAYGMGLLPFLRPLRTRPGVVFFLTTVFMLLLLLCWFGPSLFRLGGMHSY